MDRRQEATGGLSPRHHGGRRGRFLASTATALGLILLLGLFSPPCLRRPEPIFSGRPGPLHLLPELAIDEGTDPRHSEARPVPSPAAGPAAPEPATEGTPAPAPSPPGAVPQGPAPPAVEQAPDGRASVALSLPSQTNPCFRLVHQVYPDYPPTVGLLPSAVRVKVAFFVDPRGEVTGAYILSSDGPPEFGEAALAAVRQWRYEPVPEQCAEVSGFWQPLLVVFERPVPVPGPPAGR